jgi:hypothetical protein
MSRACSPREREVDLDERIILNWVLEEEDRECGLDTPGFV